MLRISRAGLSILALLAASWVVAQEARLGDHPASLSGYAAVYQENCAVCHGDRLQGAAQGTRLIGIDLKHGDSFAEISASIANGFADKGMPAWSQTMTDLQIKNIALFVSETRSGLDYADFKYDAPFSLPTQTIATELNSFTLETVIDGLEPLPFSIAPLPDGRILLTEKKRGLSIVAPEGKQSPYIAGTPRTYSDTYILAVKQEWGNGWMLDVTLHPQYEENGWIYLHYGDRCSDCNEFSHQQNRRFQ